LGSPQSQLIWPQGREFSTLSAGGKEFAWPFEGLIGEPHVNVQTLNLALDAEQAA